MSTIILLTILVELALATRLYFDHAPQRHKRQRSTRVRIAR